jgi:hypothetical protein
MINYFVLEEVTDDGEVLTTFIPDTKDNEESIMKIEEYIEALCEFDNSLDDVFSFWRGELDKGTLKLLSSTYGIIVAESFDPNFLKQDWKHLDSMKDDLYVEDTLITQDVLERYLIS